MIRNGRRVGPSRRIYSCTPERWIASIVPLAIWIQLREGLSLLDIAKTRILFKKAFSLHGEHILSSQLATRNAPHFHLLSEVFDACDPIVFYFHARDEDVRKFPQHLAPNTSGKEKAYFFLTASKGRMRYTHLGRHPGVTKQQLRRDIEEGGGRWAFSYSSFRERSGGIARSRRNIHRLLPPHQRSGGIPVPYLLRPPRFLRRVRLDRLPKVRLAGGCVGIEMRETACPEGS